MSDAHARGHECPPFELCKVARSAGKEAGMENGAVARQQGTAGEGGDVAGLGVSMTED